MESFCIGQKQYCKELDPTFIACKPHSSCVRGGSSPFRMVPCIGQNILDDILSNNCTQIRPIPHWFATMTLLLLRAAIPCNQNFIVSLQTHECAGRCALPSSSSSSSSRWSITADKNILYELLVNDLTDLADADDDVIPSAPTRKAIPSHPKNEITVSCEPH